MNDTFQEMIPGCEVPLLRAIDPGGAIVGNRPDGSIWAVKTPETSEKTQYLPGYKEALYGADMVIIERQLPRTTTDTRITENSVYPNYRELVGYLQGCGIPIYPILPQAWYKFLNFPTSATLVPKRATPDPKVFEYLIQKSSDIEPQWHILTKKELAVEKYKVWKNFLHARAIREFPKQQVSKYACDAFLLYKVATMLHPIPRALWP